MLRNLEFLQWSLSSFVYVISFILVACTGVYAIRKLIPAHKLKESHDVVGFTFSIIGVIYAVLLGFTVVNVQDRFNKAKMISETEANFAADLYRDAAMLGDKPSAEIRKLLMDYIKYVVDEEWDLMDTGDVSDDVVITLKKIWDVYYSIEPKDVRQQVWLAESVSKLNELQNIRLQRVYNSNDSLSEILWVLLYVGAAITLCFLGLFYVENFKLHLVITALLAGLLGFMLYLIQALDSVYYGDISVKPMALERVRFFLTRWY